jgi:aminomethyltransferase
MTSSLVEREYRAIREAIGVRPADLAILEVRGVDAALWLDGVAAGPVGRLVENRVLWTAILEEDGRVLADVQIYNDFGSSLVTCDTDVRAPLLAALDDARAAGIEVEDVSDRYSVFAVEGPDARGIPAKVIGPEARGLSLLSFTRCAIAGADGILSRIGFTGEFGYQFFVAPERVDTFVELIGVAVPGAVAASPATMDLLRLEMRSFNRGLDVPRGESGLQAGLHWMIDFRKPEFPGRDAVMAEVAAGPARRMMCVVAHEGVVATGAEISDGERRVGYVANAAWSPAVGHAVGLAYVDAAYAWVGLELCADGVPVRLVSAPFLVTESLRRSTGS